MIEIRLINGRTSRVDYIVEYMSIDGKDYSIAYKYSIRADRRIVTTYRVVAHNSYGALWTKQMLSI